MSAPDEAMRNIMVWQMQALACLKRACATPGQMQETVLDLGNGREVCITVMAQERINLLVPPDDDDA